MSTKIDLSPKREKTEPSSLGISLLISLSLWKELKFKTNPYEDLNKIRVKKTPLDVYMLHLQQ